MFLQQRKLNSKNLTKKVILFSIFTMGTIFSGAAFSADEEEDPGETIVIICGAECEQDSINPGGGGGGPPPPTPPPSPPLIGGGGSPPPPPPDEEEEEEETREECVTRIDKTVEKCQGLVSSIGRWGFGAFCMQVGRTLGPVGAFLCGGGAWSNIVLMQDRCTMAGVNAKRQQCPVP